MSATVFEYTAVDREGVRHTGVKPAATQNEAFRLLSAAGLTPVTLKPARGATSDDGVRKGKGRKRGGVGLKDLAHFTYQLGVMISARIPIGEGLKSIGAQEPNARLKAIILDVAASIESGEQIATALEKHRETFGAMYIAMIRAAEKSGNLSKVLDLLAETMERNLETRRQVVGALTYPACVVGVLVLAVGFLLGFVVPRFATMFEKRGLDLPMFTQGLMAVGKSVQHYWWLYLLVGAASFFGVRAAWRSPVGRQRIDALLHRVPYLNRILVGLAISRFCRILGVSLGSGLGLIDALEMAGSASARPMLQRDVELMTAQVRQGGRLSQVLGGCTYLSAFAKRMLSAGEESAELPRMCSVVARHYDRETAHLTKNLGTVIEPVLIVVIAGIVLMVALAIFLPMWNMVQLMR